MDLLDVALLGIGGYCAWAGYRRGIIWVGLALLGLVVGLIGGALLAGPIARLIAGNNFDHAQLRALIASFVLVAFVLGLESGGAWLGYRLRLAGFEIKFVRLDDLGGAALAVLGVLLLTWFFGQVFVNSRFAALDSQIQNSAVVRVLAKIAPNPPGFLAQVELALNDPNTLGGVLGGGDIRQEPVPAAFSTIPLKLATGVAQTVQVFSQGGDCVGDSGSGWPIGPKLIVTAAHVVAGGKNFQVALRGGGNELASEVVFYDPNVDFAVLYVPAGKFTALTISQLEPGPGVKAAAIGYPLGGPEKVTAATVRGIETAQGPNLYLTGTVVRSLIVLAANLEGGDSGGPLLDLNGEVIGMTVATSTTDNTEGYALAVSEISADLKAAVGKKTSVGTGACLG